MIETAHTDPNLNIEQKVQDGTMLKKDVIERITAPPPLSHPQAVSN